MLKFTGERMIPGECDVDLMNEHKARYHFARHFAAGKRVLDVACGSGYGTALLAETAAAVTGIDVSPEAVEYCRTHYTAANTEFSQADCMAMPFPSASLDVVIAFEIIEHLPDTAAFLRELKRIVAPSGLVIISTPNHQYYTVERGEINPFHKREFLYAEFQDVLQSLFSHCKILHENHSLGVLFEPADQPAGFGSDVLISTVQNRPQARDLENEHEGSHFFVAVCSEQPLDHIAPLLYLPFSGNILRKREKHIQKLSTYLDAADANLERSRAVVSRLQGEISELNATLEERAQWTQQVDRELSLKNEFVVRLQTDYEQKIEWARSLEGDLQRAREALQRLQQEFEERTAWALHLDAELKARDPRPDDQ